MCRDWCKCGYSGYSVLVSATRKSPEEYITFGANYQLNLLKQLSITFRCLLKTSTRTITSARETHLLNWRFWPVTSCSDQLVAGTISPPINQGDRVGCVIHAMCTQSTWKWFPTFLTSPQIDNVVTHRGSIELLISARAIKVKGWPPEVT